MVISWQSSERAAGGDGRYTCCQTGPITAAFSVRSGWEERRFIRWLGSSLGPRVVKEADVMCKTLT